MDKKGKCKFYLNDNNRDLLELTVLISANSITEA